MSQNGKGRGPEKGVNWSKFREGYDKIDWTKKPKDDGLIDCDSCNGRGLVADPQHGHGLKCTKCNGKGKIKETKDTIRPHKGDN